MKYLISLLPLLCLLSVFSCTPDDEVVTADPGAVLSFSADTVLFDTVFVARGSITKRLKVYNPNKKAVRISDITLGGSGASPYKLTINGVESPIANNLELRGRDSLFILVKVNIDPSDVSQPFLVSDSIMFRTNGNLQKVKLVAYGQNAYFHSKAAIGTTVWGSDKAHVLLDTILVRAGETLTIEKGTQVFATPGAVLLVNGTLLVEGTPEERVVFSGYRREQSYQQAPGQWQGIQILTQSENNRIRYADIRNTVWGFRIGNPGKGGTLIEGCAIQYAFQDGIIGFTSNISVVNTLIHNCGRYGFSGLGGGNYEVVYTTIVNYNNPMQRESPSFVITDYIPGTEIRNMEANLRLVNSIVYSDGFNFKDELLLESDGGSITAEVANNVLRTEIFKDLLGEDGNILNQDPKFVAASKQDFSLDTLSVASGAAKPLLDVRRDLKGQSRSTTKPDIGAFERTVD
ncbi:right-handed parallel beta-helix repeat-containing protein [Pontibacter beigongshangensis]|uniref:right-handed parallel beta-helix repeat-containing protein n=1 Tax=Pontibacter beigongshangensis TaxID=2574733 RepID=UPI00164FC40C|nr:right-handed parallel beta-helix repeat-containing protein [Pontibacter beigongshangensis]